MKNVMCLFVMLAMTACSSSSPPAAAPTAQASTGEHQHAEGEACDHEECAHHGGGEGHECGHHEGAASSGAPASATNLYGQQPNAALPITPLATVLASPAQYSGQVVRTEGEVSAVCQRMGCWMELRAEGGTVRVPIAGHAFFLPRNVTGRRAVIEGTVSVTELSEAQRAHLASEGAQALGAGVSISATGVQLQ